MAHAIVLVGLRRPPRVVVVETPSATPLELGDEIAIEPAPEAAAEVDRASAPATAPPEASRLARVDAHPSAHAPRDESADAEMVRDPNESPAATARAEPAAPAASGASAASPTGAAPLSFDALGLTGGNRFLGTAAEADRAEREAQRAEQYARDHTIEREMIKDLRTHDVKAGLGSDGPVLVALEAATTASMAPTNGRARFAIVADANGIVTDVTCTDANGDRTAWADVATRARDALRGKRLRMPARAKGVKMTIELASALKLPSGHDPGADVNVFGVPLKHGEGKHATSVSLLDPIPKIVKNDEAPTDDPAAKLPTYKLEWNLVKVEGDPVDIGQRAHRVVHAHVVDENYL